MAEETVYVKRAWINVLAGLVSALFIVLTPILLGMGLLNTSLLTLAVIVLVVLMGAFLLDLAWEGKALALWVLALTLLGGWLLANLYLGQ